MKFDYWRVYQKTLCIAAQEHYIAWKKAQRCKYINNDSSPYDHGYSQPGWMQEMCKALGKDDEERVKYIFMIESQYDPKLLDYRKSVINGEQTK